MSTSGTYAHLKQSTQLRLLNELSTKLQSLMISENIFQEITSLIQSKFNYHGIHIWSVNPHGTATLRAQAGVYRGHIEIGHQLKLGEGIVGAVVKSKRSYLSNDVSKDDQFTNLSVPVNTKSELCVPIFSNYEVIGVINVESDEIQAFDENDQIAMETIASQVSVVLNNQKLYLEAKEFSRVLQQTVREKTAELRDAHDRILEQQREQQRHLQRENKALKSIVNQEQRGMEIIGESTEFKNLLSMVDKIAPTTATVLIQGESGTGKELIARRLHVQSERAEHPYVTVNCGTLQESLLESELFGHEKGSFTGAVQQKTGLCETADGGTLFLDEIGELSLSIQTKLLRFLQEGEFYRIGGKKPIKVNVRVVSATNRDLSEEVKHGRFREDLYYRLNTITLRIPPLRKRVEDIPLLADYFLKNSKFGGSSSAKKIETKVYEIFQHYAWPGNIRELQNTIERLKILSDGDTIKVEDIPYAIRMPKSKSETAEFSVDMPLESLEKGHILRTLTYYHGNKTKTANSLGITVKTLYNKLHRYGVAVGDSMSTEESLGNKN